ncbi:MAG TPA: TonB-dependent siderophore receptor [Gemmatimonadaceae bacterium]|nr:TonB-dependent siderophore receptor [Gemmatimonadaceae bacterium]
MRTALFLAATLLAAPLGAQSADSVRARGDSAATPIDSATGRPPTALREVRVTAPRPKGYTAPRALASTRTDVPLLDTPQSVSVVTHVLIGDQAMRSMADVVRYIPGITMGQGEGHRDQPTIRGNSSTADFFVDGVRDDVQYLRDVYNVERVEALKGSNAMLFGRGGGGGVLNRVTKVADRLAHRQLTAETGAFGHRRASVDGGGMVTGRLSARLNGMYENSESYRDVIGVERWGANPTLSFFGARTTARLGYEHFDDKRGVDRGIPSYRGAPSPARVSAFFGDPAVNQASARVDGGRLLVEHLAPAGITIRNQTRFTSYDKFYQNVVPGAVNAARTDVTLSAYNHATQRANLFNQTDVTLGRATGRIWHALLVGVEGGRQRTTNFRNTGYFANGGATTTVPFERPTVSVPVTFRQSATDANNDVAANVAAVYAQDQVTLSPRWQAVLGARWERFAIEVDDHRSGATLRRTDAMASPRGGLVFKPARPVSLYASFGTSRLPSSGDQFSSLTATTATLEPERFTNYELGGKWEVLPELELTSAAYRLDRTNTQAKDPLDPSRTVQTGAQRTTGYEVSVLGSPLARWQVAGGFAAQRARYVRATTAARAGATVPLVPARTLSLWNRVQLFEPLGVALGTIHQARSYAAIDNTVTLPAFTRIDAALFADLPGGLALQLNAENLTNVRYFPTSQGNNNILPGSPRSWRVMLSTGR